YDKIVLIFYMPLVVTYHLFWIFVAALVCICSGCSQSVSRMSLLNRKKISMTISEFDALKVEIDERVPDLIAMRRDLHEHPETAFEELRTSGIVAQRLKSLGFEVQTGI